MTKRFQDLHEEFQAAVLDPETCLTYRFAVREALIPWVHGWHVFYPRDHLEKMNSARIREVPIPFQKFTEVDYCPWSGKLLPGKLVERRVRVIKQEFGSPQPRSYQPEYNTYVYPPEFVTEEWFLTRNIDARRRPKLSPRRWEPVEYPIGYVDQYGWNLEHGMDWQGREAPPHLCLGMQLVFWNTRQNFKYIPFTREYGFGRVVPERCTEFLPMRIRTIRYCPFCGTELPPSLKQAWYETLAAEKIDPNDDGLPAKYLSDTWWKELGL
jgi:hypothetical protein